MRRVITILASFCAGALALAQNPVIPMTAVTGKPDRAAVTEMLEAYREVGIEQFLIYPRSGLEIEYMSDEWMAFCRNCLEVADSLDMKVWLYDEYNWPSGSCKGQVTADGHEDCYPSLLLFDKGKDGRYTTRVMHNPIGADILNPEAVSRFVQFTHERYYSEFKEYFGRVIPAIFTDEPSFSYSTNANKGMLEANFTNFDHDHFPLAWYPGLEEDYAALTGGRDLHEDVIAYLGGAESGALWTGYYTAVGDRMRKTYIETLSKWCEGHGIALTGHLMYEKLYKSVRCNGNPLKSLSLFGIPGFDEANSDIDIRAREMEISGLALAQYAGRGKAGEMCELYSVGPADLTMSHMRQLMWMCAAFGVNNYIVAVASMDARGNREKGDWYFHSGRTQPWFDYYREFTAEAARAAEYARKPYEPQVLVRVPLSYFMSLDKTPAFEERGKLYLRFLEALLMHQVQFMLLDEDENGAEGLPVLGFGPDGFFIEGEAPRYRDMDAYMARVNSLAPRRVIVREADGSETRDVLVRSWADGSITLVDITDRDTTDRLLEVSVGAQKGLVRLQGHGAFAGTLSDMHAAMPVPAGDMHMKHISVTPQGPNTLRCIYTMDSPCFEFTVKRRTKGVRFILRRDVDPVEATLDGKPLRAEMPAEGIAEGFRQLYAMTDEMTLAPGTHRVEVTNATMDCRYLPSIFMCGDFSVDRDNNVTPGYAEGMEPMEVLPGYAGTYDITSRIEIPDGDGMSIALDVNLACVELLLDGVPLGRKGWGPYEWRIPQGIHGRHTLTVRISTSIMPLFGPVGKLDEDQPYVSWLRIKPGMHGDKTSTGVFKASFVR